MIQVSIGEEIPIFVILEDGATDRVVEADLINPYTGEALQSDLALTYVAASDGHYQYGGTAITMPNTANLLLVYRVYESDGLTLVAKDSEPVILASAGSGGSGGSSAETIVAIVDDNEVIGVVEEAS